MTRIERVWVGPAKGAVRAARRRRRGGSGMPIGFALATGFAAVFVGTAVAAVAPRHDPGLRVTVVAAFVAVAAALSATWDGAACAAGMGWLYQRVSGERSG